jgi:hypothetical protein
MSDEKAPETLDETAPKAPVRATGVSLEVHNALHDYVVELEARLKTLETKLKHWI